jgi:hypothetical protein
VKPSHRLASFQKNTTGDLHAAVGLQFQRIQRLPGNAVGVGDVDALGDRAVGNARFAKVESPVAVDRGIVVADHRLENVGSRKDFLNGWRRMGIGGRGIVTADYFSLRCS